MIKTDGDKLLVDAWVDYTVGKIPESGEDAFLYYLLSIAGSIMLHEGIESIDIPAELFGELASIEIDTNDSSIMKIKVKRKETPE